MYRFGFGNKTCSVLEIIKHFGKHCSYRLQDEYVMVELFLAALCTPGSRWRVGFRGVCCCKGRAGCSPVVDERVVEVKR